MFFKLSCPFHQAGYQITQQRLPLAVNGTVNFSIFDWTGKQAPSHHSVAIKQVQLENDSGKSLHDDDKHMSLVDLNRTGKHTGEMGVGVVVSMCEQ